MKIAHISDLHFCRKISLKKLDALGRDLLEQAPELLVVTGDVTDRGTIAQFRSAKDFFNSVGIPFIAVPGNREIALSAVLEWMFPSWLAMRRYSRFFGQSDRVVHRDESRNILFIGLNSVHWFPAWPGRIPRATRYWLKAFAKDHSTYTKILFLHHPVLPVIRGSSYWAHGLSDAGELLNICTQTGIDLILQGHKHRSAVMEVSVPGRNSRVVVSCGGAPLMSSWDSSYHTIRLGEKAFEVRTREFREAEFVETGAYEFSRCCANSGD